MRGRLFHTGQVRLSSFDLIVSAELELTEVNAAAPDWGQILLIFVLRLAARHGAKLGGILQILRLLLRLGGGGELCSVRQVLWALRSLLGGLGL